MLRCGPPARSPQRQAPRIAPSVANVHHEIPAVEKDVSPGTSLEEGDDGDAECHPAPAREHPSCGALGHRGVGHREVVDLIHDFLPNGKDSRAARWRIVKNRPVWVVDGKGRP